MKLCHLPACKSWMELLARTFSELASFELHLLKSTSSEHSTRTDLIVDQYPAISIKNPERTNRSAGEAIQIKIQGGSQKCPTQWKKCLCDGMNKTWQPFLGKSDSNYTAGHGLPALVNCMSPMVQNATSWLLGRKASPAVGWMSYAHSKSKRTPASYCMPVMHHLVDMTASSSSHQTQMLACTFSHRINARMLLCTGTKQ